MLRVQRRVRIGVLSVILSLIVLSCVSGDTVVLAQETDNRARLTAYMEKARSTPYCGQADFVLEEGEFPLLEPYFEDSSFCVQSYSLILAGECAEASSSTLLLQRVVEKLLEKAFVRETSGGMTQRIPLPRYENEELYSKKSIELLEKQIHKAVEEYRNSKDSYIEGTLRDLIVCAGKSRNKQLLNILGKIKREFGYVFEDLDRRYTPTNKHMQNRECPWFNSVAWKAALARARIGSDEDLKFCIDLVDKFPDPEFRSLVLLRDLASIDRPELFEYYYQCLDRNESYAEPSGDRVRYGTAVMSAMLGCIDDDEIRKKVDIKSPDAIQQLKTYVQEKAGGDPAKLRFRHRRSLFERSMKSLKERRDFLREKHTAEARNTPAENAPSVR